MLAIEAMEFIDPKVIEKLALAKRVGQFLHLDQSAEELMVVENIAKMLMDDICVQVREVLAFEVRSCMSLSPELATKIAKDVEDVASPFLTDTQAFSDEALAALIPILHEFARVTISRRSDIGDKVKLALVECSGEKAMSYLVRNDHITLPKNALSILVKRFGNSRIIMDQLSARGDLPLMIIEQMIDRVSDHCRTAMVQHYAVEGSVADKLAEASKLDSLWARVKEASPQQVHAFVNELRSSQKLNPLLALEMGERGSKQFIYSFLALNAQLSLCEVKDILTLDHPARFVDLMKFAGIDNQMGPRFLKLVKLWQTNDNEKFTPVSSPRAVIVNE